MTSILLLILLIIALIAGFGWKNIGYHLLLKRHIGDWQKKGWVTPEGAEGILREHSPKGLGNHLIFLVGLLGAILLLFSAISFVAANWSDMSRLSRLTWLIVCLWFTFFAGWRLVANKHPVLAEIAHILGIGLFGVNIVLIAQMYHIDSHPPAGIFMWTIGALATTILLRSPSVLLLTYAGTITWSLLESLSYGAVIHWPFLPLWSALLLVSIWWRWKPAYHTALLTLLMWLIMSLVRYGIEVHWSALGVPASVTVLFLFLFAISFILRANSRDLDFEGFENWLEKYSAIGLLASLFTLQTIKYRALDSADPGPLYLLQGAIGWLPVVLLLGVATFVMLVLSWREKLLLGWDLVILTAIYALTLIFTLLGSSSMLSETSYDFLSTWVYGMVYLGLAIWFMIFGHRRLSNLYVWGALIAFATEVLYIYFRIFGSLLETSLFFFMGGILTLALAFLLYRLHQRLDDETMEPDDEFHSEVSK